MFKVVVGGFSTVAGVAGGGRASSSADLKLDRRDIGSVVL